MYLKIIFLLFMIISSITISFSSNELILNIEEGSCIQLLTELQVRLQNETKIPNFSNYTELIGYNVTIYDGPIKSFGILTSFRSSKENFKYTFMNENNYAYEIIPLESENLSKQSGEIKIYECSVNSTNEIKEVISINSLLLQSKAHYDKENYVAEFFTPFSYQEIENESVGMQYLEVYLKSGNQVPELFVNSSHNVWYFKDNTWTEVSESIPQIGSKKIKIVFEKKVEAINEVEDKENSNSNTENLNNPESNKEDSTITQIDDKSELVSIPSKKPSITTKEITQKTSKNVNSNNTSLIGYIIGFLFFLTIIFSIFYFFTSQRKSKFEESLEISEEVNNGDYSKILWETKIKTYYSHHQTLSDEQIIDYFKKLGAEETLIISILEEVKKEFN